MKINIGKLTITACFGVAMLSIGLSLAAKRQVELDVVHQALIGETTVKAIRIEEGSVRSVKHLNVNGVLIPVTEVVTFNYGVNHVPIFTDTTGFKPEDKVWVYWMQQVTPTSTNEVPVIRRKTK